MNWVDWLVDKIATAVCGDLDRQFEYAHECQWRKVFRWKRDQWVVIPVGYGYITVLAPKGWYLVGHACRVCGARK